MPIPLKLSSLERKAKRVHVSKSWRDAVGLVRRQDIQQQLEEIRRYISAELDLPERFYRRNRDSTPDRLLAEDGILHLHLGHPGTSELLFLVQYASDVVFLELSTHYHFEFEPPGSVLRQLHDAKLAEWEAEREGEIQALRQSIRDRLKPQL